MENELEDRNRCILFALEFEVDEDSDPGGVGQSTFNAAILASCRIANRVSVGSTWFNRSVVGRPDAISCTLPGDPRVWLVCCESPRLSALIQGGVDR